MVKVHIISFIQGEDAEREVSNKINTCLEELSHKGIYDVDIQITSTGKGVVYTLTWFEEE